jgi:carbamoyltransferase
MRVLGLSALTHDPAAVLLGEHGIEAAMEESKLVRVRTTAGIPRAAMQYCLDHTEISWSDVACVAVASRPLRAWMRHALFRARRTPLAPISSGYYQTKAAGELGRELNNFRILELMKANPKSRLLQLDHHLCHAASAFYASPFDRALILTLDEQGDGRSGLVALGEGARIRVRHSIPFPHSPAWVYSQVTELVGYQPHHEEHKTQWLSLAGDPVFADLFVDMFRRERSVPRLNSRFFNRGVAGHLAFSDYFYRQIGIAPSPEARAGDALRAQLAASVQKATETLVARWLELLRKRTGARFLCLAGGLFLNPLLVAALEENTGFERIFVQPAAGNEGTALGAAWLVWHRQWSKPRGDALTRLDWGPSYSNEEIKQVLDNCKAGYRWMNSDAERLDETLRLLQAGRIVGWFQGAAEFGPRALGNRSLLASPFAPYVKENLNDYVKHRESFRPFALAVTEEDCARYFDCSPLGRFMATLGRARAEHRRLLEGFLLPGDRARVQIVSRDVNPLLWALLKRFGEKAPAPLLVNTSFNLFGEPLVVTPRDAVRSYFCSGTDALVIGNFVLSKS